MFQVNNKDVDLPQLNSFCCKFKQIQYSCLVMLPLAWSMYPICMEDNISDF